MALKSAKAFYGLQGIFDLTSAATTGEAIVGQGSTPVTLPTTGQAWAVEIEVDGAGEVEINLETAAVTVTGAGTAQVETATAAGTITGSGNATVTVTGDDITGSPLAVSVAVVNGDTAATWANKVRSALGAVAAITDKYTVGGSGTAITLTRTTPRRNDSTLNIALANGTCTGITAAATSANTTAGVNPATCTRLVGVPFAEDDAEGKPLIVGLISAVLLMVDSNSHFLVIDSNTWTTESFSAGEILLKAGATDTGTEPVWTFSSSSTYSKATLVVINA